MSTFKLHPAADLDLTRIYHYSVEEWGLSRAEQYIRDLESAFKGLAVGDLSSKDAGFILPGLRSYRVVSHVVFFKQTSDGIIVIRVLHKSMDFERHL